jgi:hypothetical protein
MASESAGVSAAAVCTLSAPLTRIVQLIPLLQTTT